MAYLVRIFLWVQKIEQWYLLFAVVQKTIGHFFNYRLFSWRHWNYRACVGCSWLRNKKSTFCKFLDLPEHCVLSSKLLYDSYLCLAVDFEPLKVKNIILTWPRLTYTRPAFQLQTMHKSHIIQIILKIYLWSILQDDTLCNWLCDFQSYILLFDSTCIVDWLRLRDGKMH